MLQPTAAEAAEDVARHRRVVRAFVSKLVADPSLSEDLTQETLARIHASDARFRGSATERTWLCAVAHNVVRDHYRAVRRRPATTADPEDLDRVAADTDIEADLLYAEMASCIGDFITRLSPVQSKVVALHDLADLGHPEIADALGITVENSRVLLHRGHRALRHLLETHCRLSFGTDAIPCEWRDSSDCK